VKENLAVRAPDQPSQPFPGTELNEQTLARLRQAKTAVWRRPAPAWDALTLADVVQARARFQRFAPVLSRLFPGSDWDGGVASALLAYPPCEGLPPLWVKADHALPMTGSIKARGGVHELLCHVERIAAAEGIVLEGDLYAALTTDAARACFARHSVVVASTGNLGFSIGLVARVFGLGAEIHMSHDAKEWKKARLRKLGARVVEHAADFTETVERARVAAAAQPGAYFVDDEASRELMLGYAVAAYELAEQLAARQIEVGPQQPLFVYLPCGVGGAPGGITFGLKHLFGRDVICVMVEPTASAAMFVALAQGEPPTPRHVSEFGLDNRTIADGLAVPRASPLALAVVGRLIDAVVAVSDQHLLDWIRAASRDAGLRLEPAAAAGFAAVQPWLQSLEAAGRDAASLHPHWHTGTHVVWTTGGSLLPDEEFAQLLG